MPVLTVRTQPCYGLPVSAVVSARRCVALNLTGSGGWAALSAATNTTGPFSLWFHFLSLNQVNSGNPRLLANAHVDTGDQGLQWYPGGLQLRTSASYVTLPMYWSTNAGVWHTALLWYDGTTFAAYVDGVLIASAASSGTISPPRALTFGYNPTYSGDWWSGKVYDVAFFPFALSLPGRAALFSSGSGATRGNTIIGLGPTCWLPLNDMRGTAAIDVMGAANGSYSGGSQCILGTPGG
jgi:hypothetical protein